MSVGSLRWDELINVCDEFLLGSASKGPFAEVVPVFSYLKTHTNTKFVFDPHVPNLWDSCERMIPKQDWKETPYYKRSDESLNESIPESVSKPLGQGIVMNA